MSIENDKTNLGMTLPIRYKSTLREYMDMVYSEFGPPSRLSRDAFDAIIDSCHDSVLLTEDESDSGVRVSVSRADGFSFKLTPLNIAFHRIVGDCLFFIDSDLFIYSFTSGFNYEVGGEYFFFIPDVVLKRASRKSKRVPCTGKVEMHNDNGPDITGDLNDISINGISIVVGHDHKLKNGDNYVVRIVTEYGVASIDARVKRIEPLSLVSSKSLIGLEVDSIEGNMEFRHILKMSINKRKEDIVSKSGIIDTSPLRPRVNYSMNDFS